MMNGNFFIHGEENPTASFLSNGVISGSWYKKDCDEELLDLAEGIIKKSFEGKVDKSGKPYLDHLVYVGSLASIFNLPFDKNKRLILEIVGLLHDLLEDCPEWTEGALRHLFPDNIVDSIVVLTKLKGEKYEDYIGRVLKNKYARIVKKFDLQHNMDLTRLSVITDKDIERTKKYHTAYNRILAYEQELKDNQ